MAAAAAAQKAPETKQNQNAKASAQKQAPKVSQPVGIAVMVVLLVMSLIVGNGRALSKATPKAFLRQGEVASLLQDRVNGARNAETVAKRADLETTLYSEVEKVMQKNKAERHIRGGMATKRKYEIAKCNKFR